jgi:predicted transposase YbfD/YdcC
MDIFLSTFDDIPDPRADNARHDLCEPLVAGFVAVLCGATSCAEMADFGREREHVFRGFLKLKQSIPSHDTVSTVFRMIDPKALDAAIGRVLAQIAVLPGDGDVIAIDGKALRGARDKGQSAGQSEGQIARTRMMVAACAARLRLTLARVAADPGGGLEAALEVPGLIALKGKVVTADALHGNRRTVAAIRQGGGGCCLALKANQDPLLSDARSCFGKALTDHPVTRHQEAGHGRNETRTGTVVSARGLAEHPEFPGLQAFDRIEARRETDGKVQTQTRYYALSWVPEPKVFIATSRAHWGIGNALHWQLDVAYRKDAARNRKDNSPANIAILRRRALDRRDTSKGSLSVKLKREGWNDAFLLSLLNQLASA